MGPQTSRIAADSAVFDGAYELLATVGRGRSSVVYQARRLASPKLQIAGPGIIALKVLVENPKNPDANVKRMQRESLALLACRHRNIIRLYDFIASDSVCYLAMEFAEGGDLRALLEARDTPLPFEFSCEIIIDVLRGVEAIHRAGIIHRDLKPENILLTKDQQIKITDFGVAYLPVEKRNVDDATLAVGTLDYLAPECLEQTTLDVRSDLYSVAVTFYQLLTCHLPFEATALAAQINDKLAGNFRPMNELPEGERRNLVESFFRQALAPEPAARFQTAAEFRDAVAQLLIGAWVPNAEIEARKAVPKKLLAVGMEKLAEPDEEEIIQDRDWMEQNRMQITGSFEAVQDFPEQLTISQPPQMKKLAKRRTSLLPRLREHSKQLGLILACLVVLGFAIANRKQFHNWHALLPSKTKTAAPATKNVPSPIDSVLSVAPEAAIVEKASVAESALIGERTGMLENLFVDGADLPFVLAIQSSNKAIVALGLIGFEPTEFDPSALLRGEKVTISGSGITLNLLSETTVSDLSSGLRGTYQELGTGRQGRWRLW